MGRGGLWPCCPLLSSVPSSSIQERPLGFPLHPVRKGLWRRSRMFLLGWLGAGCPQRHHSCSKSQMFWGIIPAFEPPDGTSTISQGDPNVPTQGMCSTREPLAWRRGYPVRSLHAESPEVCFTLLSEASQPCLSPRSHSPCFLNFLCLLLGDIIRKASCEGTGDPRSLCRQETGTPHQSPTLLPHPWGDLLAITCGSALLS